MGKVKTIDTAVAKRAKWGNGGKVREIADFDKLRFVREFREGDWNGVKFRLIAVNEHEDDATVEAIGDWTKYEGLATVKVKNSAGESRTYASATNYYGGQYPELFIIEPADNLLTDRVPATWRPNEVSDA